MHSVFFPHLVNDPGGDPSLYIRLAHRREALLFDCGDLHQLRPRERLKIKAVFLSHCHIDHLIGFDTLLRQFLYQDAHLLFHGPPGTIERIGARLAGYSWNLLQGYPLQLIVREWGAPLGRETRFRAAQAFSPEAVLPFACPDGLLFRTDHCQVRAVPLTHGDLISLAFVLEEPLHVAIHKDALLRERLQPGPWLAQLKEGLQKGIDPQSTIVATDSAGRGEKWTLATLAERIAHCERGMKVAYVTDVSPTEENLQAIVSLAENAHLLAIEAVFAHQDLARAKERHHLTAYLAGSVARAAGVARLLTFHHSPRYQDTPELLSAEAEEAFALHRPEAVKDTPES